MKPLLARGFLIAKFLDSVQEDFLRIEVSKLRRIGYFDLAIGLRKAVSRFLLDHYRLQMASSWFQKLPLT